MEINLEPIIPWNSTTGEGTGLDARTVIMQNFNTLKSAVIALENNLSLSDSEKYALALQLATQLIDTKIDALKAGAPAAYDTLLEIANKLAEDDNALANLLEAVSLKLDKSVLILKDDVGNPILDEEGNPIYTFLTHAEAPLPTVHAFEELSEWNHAGGELIRQLYDESATTEYVDSLIEPIVLSIDDLNAAVAGIEDAIDLLADTKFDEDNVINDQSVVTGTDKVWSISAAVGYITNTIQKSYDRMLAVVNAKVAVLNNDIETTRMWVNDAQDSANMAQSTANLGSPFDQFAIVDGNGEYITDGTGNKIYAILNY